MVNKVRIGGDGGLAGTHRDPIDGMVTACVSVRSGLDEIPKSIFFSNVDDGSININIDASAGGATDNVYNGGDSAGWSPSAISGTWNFTSGSPVNSGSFAVDATATVNGDQALFTRSSAIDSSLYTAFNGFIQLDNYNPTRHRVDVFFRLAGVIVGSTVDIGTKINTSLTGSYQQFNIPLSDFGITGNVDEIVITTVRTSGPSGQPDYHLDDMQLNQGGGALFEARPDNGEWYEWGAVEILMEAPSALVSTAASMPKIPLSGFFDIPALSNGITLLYQQGGVNRFSGTLREMRDVMTAAFTIVSHGEDNANAWVKLSADLPANGRMINKDLDFFSISISDDLTSFLTLRANLRGRVLRGKA
jgi:hypothetical protein